MKEYKKYLFGFLGLGFLYKIIKSIIKKFVEISTQKNIAEYERDFNIKSYENVLGVMSRNKEVDEKVSNMSDDELNDLM